MGSIQDHNWEACFCSTAGPVGVLFHHPLLVLERNKGERNRDVEYQSPRILIIIYTHRVIKMENTLFGMKSHRLYILLESLGWAEPPRLEEASSKPIITINQWTYPTLALTRACMQLTIK